MALFSQGKAKTATTKAIIHEKRFSANELFLYIGAIIDFFYYSPSFPLTNLYNYLNRSNDEGYLNF